MVNPGSVELSHSQDGRAWLCDKIVLLDVSGSPAIAGLEVGPYRLQNNKGLIRKEGVPALDIKLALDYVKSFSWYPAWPTRWSITDNEAKAMLLFVEIMNRCPDPQCNDSTWDHECQLGGYMRFPLAMNEDVWHAFQRSYPDAQLWHSGDKGPFLVATESNSELAYIEPIPIPEDEDTQDQAMALIDASHATTRERKK